MIGTVLGDLFTEEYQTALQNLATSLKTSNEFCGLFVRDDGTVYIDGAYGRESVKRIIEACGYSLTAATRDKRGNVKAWFLSSNSDLIQTP